MSSFAALMALSASQTRESDLAVQTALAERQRKEATRRKEQDERERKQREAEAALRKKRFDDEKKEAERQLRLKEERQAAERAMLRREEEQREALRFGPKKMRAERMDRYPSHSRTHSPRRERAASPDSVGSGTAILTREEKRQRKVEADMRRSYTASRRSHTSGYRKSGARLPGGAVDILTTPGTSTPPASSSQSVKERLSAMPNTLTKLNVVKRDTRTIDEIVQDLAREKAKVLNGDQAKEFNDWFGSSKKKDVSPKKVSSTFSHSAHSPSPSATSSGVNTPSLHATSTKPSSSAIKSSSLPPIPKKPTVLTRTTSTSSITNLSKGANGKSLTPKPKPPPLDTKVSLASRSHSRPSSANGKTPTSASHARSAASKATPTARSSLATAGSPKKRLRSPSQSISPPPMKKRRSLSAARDEEEEEDEDTGARGTDYGSMIWKMFGRERQQYVNRDVLSDDEDMEVDARVLEKEELMSARIAKKEDEEAQEAERRYEDEKRRRRKEREARERRSSQG